MAIGKSNSEIIWGALIKNGFTEIATAGIMGNLQAESNFDPMILQGGGHSENIIVDGETGYGLAQWTYKSRQQFLADFAKEKQRNSGDLMVQIDFLISEINSYGIADKLNQLNTPEDAAIYFHETFENSADTEEMKQRRAVYAKAIFDSKGVGIIANVTYSGDYLTYQCGNSSLQSSISKMPSAASSSPSVSGNIPHGKHSDTIFKNPDKTYCEPVYPDLVSMNTKIPTLEVDEIVKKAKDGELEVGENMTYSVPNSTLEKYGAAGLGDIVGQNEAREQQRKVTFDAKKHRNAFKLPTCGKPPNNNDPFPFDAKIEEIESHAPYCVIKEIQTCPEAVNVARACMQLSTNVEKRLVTLENNIATILRYLGRFAARVPINCVYYGGQTTYEKYKCIRCLQDDRINDGQMMSIDQCLSCTRYEPIIGMVYDILNDSGVNLSQVLDDNQMSYTTMEEYYKFITPTEYQAENETASFDAANVKSRQVSDKDFINTWSAGLKMDWNLYPVEDQHPHINKAQNIKGETYGKLDSYPFTATNNGMTYTGSIFGNRIVANKEIMDKIIALSGEE